MSARFLIGDTRDVTASLPDGSVDLILTSPPFLALRSYLPADHPDKWREIGSEPTPAQFIDTLLELTAEWGRVLAPHGTIAIELGDTYAGQAGAAAALSSTGWPLAKSKAMIPELYRIALGYGINPLTGAQSPAGQWRVRNVVTWCRPNPPVGALGDKFRPATSDMVIACRSATRWFDLDAVRTPASPNTHARIAKGAAPRHDLPSQQRDGNWNTLAATNGDPEQGAPPLDYWVIPPGGYSGATTTTRRVPCGPRDGGERTTSADCPVHGDRTDPAPTAPRDARAGTPESHTSRTDGRHESEQLPGFAPIDPRNEHSTAPSSSDSQTQAHGPAATTHSTGSHRTDHAPATTPAGSSSARTTPDTAHTSASPESCEQHPDTPSSSTSSDGSPDLPSRQTSSDTADTPLDRLTSSSACTCSFTRVITESTSHYAVYPTGLCVTPIKAMCPRRVCTTCGEPQRRVVDTGEVLGRGRTSRSPVKQEAIGEANAVARFRPPDNATRTTLGWTTCGHNNTWRNGLVLDPFAGSGTTLLVASGHGRDSIGIDLDERNAHLAQERVGMFLTVEDHRTEAVPA